MASTTRITVLSLLAAVAIGTGCAATPFNVARPEIGPDADDATREAELARTSIVRRGNRYYLGDEPLNSGRLTYAMEDVPEAARALRSFQRRRAWRWVLVAPTAASLLFTSLAWDIASQPNCPPQPPGTFSLQSDCISDESERTEALAWAGSLTAVSAVLLALEIWVSATTAGRLGRAIDIYNGDVRRRVSRPSIALAPAPGGVSGSVSFAF
jgi:hypothetical protein